MKNNHTNLISLIAMAIMASTPAAATTNNVKNALLMALDDEYKAYATYYVMIEKFGEARPFSNIIQAEQNHIDALVTLLNKYQIQVPQNKYLSNPNKPIAPASLKLACQKGVDAEIANASLYEKKLLPMVGHNEDIKFVFQNLRDASKYRHLMAFQRCASRY